MITPTQIADNRATELRLGDKGRRVFTTAGWNSALRAAGIAAGNWWIMAYGPLRWNMAYAMGQLGYRGRKTRNLKIISVPFFEEGTWQANFNSRAKTVVVAKGGGARFWIVCPIGHGVLPRIAEYFRTIPPRERTAIAREYRRAIIQALQVGRTAVAAKATKAADRVRKAAATRVKQRAREERAHARMLAREGRYWDRLARQNERTNAGRLAE